MFNDSYSLSIYPFDLLKVLHTPILNIGEFKEIQTSQDEEKKPWLNIKEPALIESIGWGLWEDDHCKWLHLQGVDEVVVLPIESKYYPLVEVGQHVTVSAFLHEDGPTYKVEQIKVAEKQQIIFH